jgi:dipeptidyl aminopeptidase/acylaminoacyl peptidase
LAPSRKDPKIDHDDGMMARIFIVRLLVPCLLSSIHLACTMSPSTTTTQLIQKPSLITTDVVALSGVSFSDLQRSGDRLYYRCSDPSKAGKSTVVMLDGTSQETTTLMMTPETHNVRSAVHEYGGGSFVVTSKGGVVYTVFPSHEVHFREQEGGESKRIYPPEGKTSTGCRFADFCVAPTSDDGSSFSLIAVMEDHSDPKNVLNSIAKLNLDGTVSVLASGHDFYAAPSFDENTRQLAFVTWDHPNMPWDSTSLYLLELDESLETVGDPKLIHGGPDSDTSIYAPQWHPRSGKLYFLSNESGWYNVYEWTTGSSSKNILPKNADCSEGKSGWALNTPCFTFLGESKLCATYSEGGESVVVVIDLGDKNKISEYGRDLFPPTSIDSLVGCSHKLFFCGGGTKQPRGIWCWNLNAPSETAKEVVSSLSVDNLQDLQQFMSEPVLVEAKSSSRGTGRCYAYYYPPNNLSPELPNDFRPPMLVKAHGGPTARTSTTFRLDIQFWTSRGFAVLDVDYGGSTGYGKEYQKSLLGNWGVLDVDDVKYAALDRVDKGLANKDWICIDGSSAGGYTTLAALTFTDTFKAGASKYGIGDLSMLAQETHKFESRYMDRLIGPYPQAQSVYDERTPTKHIEQLNCPCILLQGDEDKVVPPSQAETMFQALKSKGVPSSLVIYKGEQHGFRKSENIGHALLSEYFFFCKIFGFVPLPEQNFDGVRIGERIEV